MTVQFNHIPSDLRVPIFAVEMDNSAANTATETSKALCIGLSLTDTSLNKPNPTSNYAKALNAYGSGSMLAEMVNKFRINEAMMSVHCLAVKENSAGAAATGSIKVTGTATASGTINLYIAERKIQVGVNEGDEAADIATAIAAAITAESKSYAKAEASETTVTLTAKWKGLSGNEIAIKLNKGGESSGEATPAGITLEITPMSGGTADPDISEALANLGDESYDFVVCGFNNPDAVKALEDFFNDSTGRWSYYKMLYGHGFIAKRCTLSEAQTYGKTLNCQHISILPFDGTDTPSWEFAAAMTGSSCNSLASTPALPLQTLPILGVSAPSIEDRFDTLERNTLLYCGMSTFTVVSGTCQIDRMITTYQKNSQGEADNSYLDVETLFTSIYVIRFLKSRITSKYSRCSLVANGTRVAEGVKAVTPNDIRNELIAAYLELELQGLVENSAIFAKYLVVELDANDPNRANILFPPDYANQLRIIALLNQFRLQYKETN